MRERLRARVVALPVARGALRHRILNPPRAIPIEVSRHEDAERIVEVAVGKPEVPLTGAIDGSCQKRKRAEGVSRARGC